MPIEPKHTPGLHPSARPFVGRGDLRALFKKTLKNKKPDQHKVLVFYGVAGIGKSRLQQQLAEDFQEMWKSLEQMGTPAVCMTLDFDRGRNRAAEDALPVIRWTLKDKYNVPFPTFDLAFAIYWQKRYPHIALNKDRSFRLWEESGLLADVVAAAGEIPIIGFIPKIGKVIERSHRHLKDWWTKRGEATLQSLAGKKDTEIEDQLPKFLAMDIKSYLQEYPVPVVIFLDTYEELFGKEHTEDIFFTRDKWVKELVAQLPEATWVITGREKLLWAKDKKEWDDHLEQYEIFGLENKHAREFIERCGIEGSDIKEAILRGSREAEDKHVPFYLNLSVDTYLRIREERKPVADDFGETPMKIFHSFIRHLNQPEVNTLKILSAARSWDDELAKVLLNQFRTDHTLAAPPDLYGFSFIKEGSTQGQRTMHDLMRRSLQEHQDKKLRKKVHQFLFTHYDNQLKGIDIKSITDTHKTALTEAFYHASEIMLPEELAGWTPKAVRVFKDAAHWAIAVQIHEDTIAVVEDRLGRDKPSVATLLNNLALLYKSQGRYAEAEPLYERALAINEKALGKHHSAVAIDLNNLAELYSATGRYAEAEPLYKRALEIGERTLGKDHPKVALLLNNLAGLYRVTGRYSEAEPLYKRALAIDEKALSKDHPDVAIDLNNLAGLYRVTGRYSEAEPLYKRAVAIHEKALGKDHPGVAIDLNNLAGLYRATGRYAEAEPLYERVVDIFEKALGKEHPHVATTLNNMALLYDVQGRYAEAESLYKRALAIDEKALSLDHPHLAGLLENMAVFYRETGRNKEAEKLEERAREIRERRKK